MSPQLTLSAYGEHVSCIGGLTPQPAQKLSKRILGRLGKEQTQKAKKPSRSVRRKFCKKFSSVLRKGANIKD